MNGFKPTMSDAIRSLGIDGGWKIKNGEIVKWYSDKTQPSEAEIDAKLVELRAEYDAQEYARNRQTEYPTIEECVHAILDNDNNELDTLQAKRAEIKLKYPKGG